MSNNDMQSNGGSHMNSGMSTGGDLVGRDQRKTQVDIAELRRNVAITGDGNVVGNDNTVAVTKIEGDLYQIQTATFTITLSLEQLHACLQSPQTNAPRIPPEVPYLHTLIGREEEKQALLETYQRVVNTGKGCTFFLLGKTGSGRRALIQWLQEQVYAEGGAIAATRFWDTRFLAAEKTAQLYWEAPVMKKYGQHLMEAFTEINEGLPHKEAWLNLAAQLTHQAEPCDVTPLDWPNTPLTLSRFVRRAARRRPLLLTVEYLDWADALWIDLLRRLADEIAQDLPVLLVITLDAPAPLEQLHDRQHTEPTRLAKTLVQADLAQSRYLGLVTPEEITAHLAPIDPDLAKRLHTLSGGDPLIVQMLWDEWCEQQAVSQRWGDTWQVNYDTAGEWWVFGDVRDHAHALLSQCLKSGPQDPPPLRIDTVESILACAALEGEVFTAAAVAQALELELDKVIDFFDDYLCRPEAADMEDPTALRDYLLVDIGFIKLPNGTDLCRYRFARPYLWHVWSKYPHASEQRQQWSAALADALEILYVPDTYRIADTLYRLFENSGQYERAEAYRRQPLAHPKLDGLRYHVRLLQQNVTEDDRFSLYRLFDRGFALLKRLVIEASDLWEEGLALAEDLAHWAAQIGDRGQQADAYYFQVWCLYIAGRYAEALPPAQRCVRIYEERHDPNSPNVAPGLNMLGLVLHALGDLAGARAAFERALHIDEAVYGPEHPKVATAVNNLGRVLQDLGDFAGARAAFERALRIAEQVLDKDHPNVATDVNNLGSVLQDLGDLAGARAAFERALRIDEALYGPKHPDVARDINNLGRVLHALGDLAGARAAFEHALQIWEVSLGPEHPNVATAVNNLGLVLHDLGDFAGARAAFERALRIDEAVYGPEHPKVAIRLNNLGNVLQALGDLAGARAAFERALQIREVSLGPEHPEVATVVNNLGSVLQDLGDLAGARAAFERALRIDEAVYGPDHPNVAIRVNNLGRVLRALGDLAGARAAYERALRIDEAIYGPEHPEVATDVNNLGGVLYALGDLAGAQAACERALRIDEAVYGPDHPAIATAVNNLGSVLQELGDLAGARAAFERALRIDEAIYGPEHPQVAAAVNNLGSVLQDLGDLAGARAAYERALQIWEVSLGPEHPNVARAVNNLGLVLHALGDLAGARAACERALRIDEAVYGPEHPEVARDVNNLGSVLHALGDLAGARAACERALCIDEAIYGPEHPKVATDVNNLGGVLRALGDLAGARAACERALWIDEAAYGPDHPNVAIRLNNLGLVLYTLGDLAGARAAFERALQILENSQLPKDHLYMVSLKNNLMKLQFKQG